MTRGTFTAHDMFEKHIDYIIFDLNIILYFILLKHDSFKSIITYI